MDQHESKELFIMIILFCSVCVLLRIFGFKKQEIQMTCSKTPWGVGWGSQEIHSYMVLALTAAFLFV